MTSADVTHLRTSEERQAVQDDWIFRYTGTNVSVLHLPWLFVRRKKQQDG